MTTSNERAIADLVTYIEAIYQQFQIDTEQFMRLLDLINNIKKENS